MKTVNTAVADRSEDGENKLLRNVDNLQQAVRYIPAYQSAQYEMSVTFKELSVIVCRMEGSATVRFAVGSWKLRGFRGTVDKNLGTVQAGVVTAVSYRVARRVITKVTVVR